MPIVEIELKFLVEPEVLEQLKAHPAFKGPEQIEQQRSVYFDTLDRDLQRSALALRVRRTDDGFMQTVKRQDGAGAIGRGEWQASVPGEAVDVEVLSQSPAAEVLDGRLAALGPVFVTTVERRARILHQDGGVVEVSFDQGEILCGERRARICEIELELKDGDPACLFELGRRLVREAPIRLSFESKGERGFRLADGAELEPRDSANAALTADMPAAEAFQHIARACLAQASGNAEVLVEARLPEALHQFRVGLRRLRAAFAAFEPMLPRADREPVEAELKWLASQLDQARDLDVFVQGAFAPFATEGDAAPFAALGRALLKAKTRSYDHALAAVKSPRYAALLLEGMAWIETGGWLNEADPLLTALRDRPCGDYARDALGRLRQVVCRRGRLFEELDSASRHKLRIRAKRLRYAVEFFAALYKDTTKRQRRFLKSLKQLQDQLGELNDVTVARERVLDDAGLKDPRLAFVAGRLVGRRESAEAELLRSASAAFDDFVEAEPFWT